MCSGQPPDRTGKTAVEHLTRHEASGLLDEWGTRYRHAPTVLPSMTTGVHVLPNGPQTVVVSNGHNTRPADEQRPTAEHS